MILLYFLPDTFLIYYLLTKHKVKLFSWVINFMIESADDPTSLPYGMVTTHLLEANNISLVDYPYITVTKSYNSRGFASMWYISVKGAWVKKQEGESKNIPSDSKAKTSVSLPSIGNPDLLEKIAFINEKLTVIKDSLTLMQSTIEDVHGVVKETGSDVSKIRVQIRKIAEKIVKTFKEVHDKIDGISVIVNGSFDRLKEAICNTHTYFLRCWCMVV